jgi:hypothetical protein
MAQRPPGRSTRWTSRSAVSSRDVLERLHAVDHIKRPALIGQRDGVAHSALDPRQLRTVALGGGDLVGTQVDGAHAPGRPHALGHLIRIETPATAHFQDPLARAKLQCIQHPTLAEPYVMALRHGALDARHVVGECQCAHGVLLSLSHGASLKPWCGPRAGFWRKACAPCGQT